jgi:hypothetical protein
METILSMAALSSSGFYYLDLFSSINITALFPSFVVVVNSKSLVLYYFYHYLRDNEHESRRFYNA